MIQFPTSFPCDLPNSGDGPIIHNFVSQGCDVLSRLLLLQANPTPPAPGIGSNLIMAVIMGSMVFVILSQISRSRKEKQEREATQAGLRKNARVMTIGGIYGTVVAVKEHDVVLKVDESSNTKMTFRKTAIQQILSDESA